MNLLYQGSVKDLMGPVNLENGAGSVPAVAFHYTDSFSVFDWGRMPDLLPHKGEALATIAANWFERLERPETWMEFSRSKEALGLRKGNQFGALFNEIGEDLQKKGLKTHYLGVRAPDGKASVQALRLASVPSAPREIWVEQVAVLKPSLGTVLGCSVPDYQKTVSSPMPRLIPLEVVFRFSCPPGSSLLSRVARDAHYLESLGYENLEIKPGQSWEFPVLELFTKLESTDRLLSLSEGLAISGISAAKLNELLLKTAWVAGWVRMVCARAGLELADGKLEWGISPDGELILVDAIGPDELRILKDGIQLSKEYLRSFYRDTEWFRAIEKAKSLSKSRGSSDWKKGLSVPVPALPPAIKTSASHIYQTLANVLTDKEWFKGAPSVPDLLKTLTGDAR
jgi:phosphoribosylaminoimidazole-succinocarboxamide synthase